MIFIFCYIIGGLFFWTPGRGGKTVFLVKKKNVWGFVMTKCYYSSSQNVRLLTIFVLFLEQIEKKNVQVHKNNLIVC